MNAAASPAAQPVPPTPTDAEQVSSWVDGELDASACSALLQRMRTDPALRRVWDEHHLAGDALRSHDVACHDCASLRRRIAVALEAEPAIVAPRLLPRARWRRWGPPLVAIAAAGAVLAIGVPVLLAPAPQDLPSQAATLPVAATVAVGALPVAHPVSAGELARDPRLERYLRAHRELGGGGLMPRATPYLRASEDVR